MARYRDRLRAKRARLYFAQGGLCYYCAQPMLLAKGPHDARLSPRHITLDHIIPKSQGGLIAENTVAACYQCNQERADSDARLFMLKKQGYL